MAKALAYLPWFPRDFLSSTRGWSVTAKGVYRELLDAQWEAGILPEDPDELRHMIGASAKEWAEGWKRCESKFPGVPGGRRNGRLEEHRQEVLKLRAGKAKGAQKTNAKRWGDVAERSVSDQSASQIAIAERVAERVADESPPNTNPKKSPQPPLEGGPPAAPGSPILEGGEAGADPDTDAYLVWTAGLQMLGAAKSNRSLLGKLVKQHGQEAVARKVGEILGMKDRPQDPAAYLVASMKRQERRFMA